MASPTNARTAYPTCNEWGSKARKAESNAMRSSARRAAIVAELKADDR